MAALQVLQEMTHTHTNTHIYMYIYVCVFKSKVYHTEQITVVFW